MFPDCKTIKLEINNRNICGKLPKMWKLNNKPIDKHFKENYIKHENRAHQNV